MLLIFVLIGMRCSLYEKLLSGAALVNVDLNDSRVLVWSFVVAFSYKSLFSLSSYF